MIPPAAPAPTIATDLILFSAVISLYSFNEHRPTVLQADEPFPGKETRERGGWEITGIRARQGNIGGLVKGLKLAC